MDPLRQFIGFQGNRIANIVEAWILRIGLVTTLPTAGEGNRGGLLRKDPGGGVAGSLHFARRNAAGTEQWVEVANTTDGYTHNHDSTYVNVTGDTMTGPLNLVGGSATASSWSKLQDGTLLTTAELGAVEFDAGLTFITPEAGNRAQVMVAHHVYQDADYTGSNGNTAQKIFDESTNGAITLPSGGKYLLDMVFHIDTTGTTSHDFRFALNGGTMTFSKVQYLAFSTLVATEIASTPALGWYVGSSEKILAGAAASATHHTVLVRGFIQVNAGGTFIPTYRWSAAPGVAGVTAEGSQMRLTPVGPTTVGNWS
jgi:hypothetical protein